MEGRFNCPRDWGEKRTSWSGFEHLLEEIRAVSCRDSDGGFEDND